MANIADTRNTTGLSITFRTKNIPLKISKKTFKVDTDIISATAYKRLCSIAKSINPNADRPLIKSKVFNLLFFIFLLTSSVNRSPTEEKSIKAII